MGATVGGPARNGARAVQDRRGCDLYRDATRAVSGEGRANARVVLVGEQPGDQENKDGRPLVGPAGRILDRALAGGAYLAT